MEEILLALLGDDAPFNKVRILMWRSQHVRDHALPAGQQLWEVHGAFLLAEAKRRGIARPPGGFAAEVLLRSSRELVATRDAQDAYRLDCKRRGINPDDPAA